jgi:hypothetical protein
MLQGRPAALAAAVPAAAVAAAVVAAAGDVFFTILIQINVGILMAVYLSSHIASPTRQ